jgi:hypothetical protein
VGIDKVTNAVNTEGYDLRVIVYPPDSNFTFGYRLHQGWRNKNAIVSSQILPKWVTLI